MLLKTVQEVIDNVKSGNEVEKEDLIQSILALSSMFIRSRMVLENIASYIGNETSLHVAARCLLGDVDFVRKEKADWLSSNAGIWLKLHSPNNLQHDE